MRYRGTKRLVPIAMFNKQENTPVNLNVFLILCVPCIEEDY